MFLLLLVVVGIGVRSKHASSISNDPCTFAVIWATIASMSMPARISSINAWFIGSPVISLTAIAIWFTIWDIWNVTIGSNLIQ